MLLGHSRLKVPESIHAPSNKSFSAAHPGIDDRYRVGDRLPDHIQRQDYRDSARPPYWRNTRISGNADSRNPSGQCECPQTSSAAGLGPFESTRWLLGQAVDAAPQILPPGNFPCRRSVTPATLLSI